MQHSTLPLFASIKFTLINEIVTTFMLLTKVAVLRCFVDQLS